MKIYPYAPNNRYSLLIRKHGGFALIELIVSTVILVIVGMMAIRISSHSTGAMQRMSLRSKVDSAVAARMEEIRTEAFRYLCTQGCDDGELGQELTYNTAALEPLCENKSLGESLLEVLKTKDKVGNFNLTEYDQSADSIPINSALIATENKIVVSISESTTNTQIDSVIVPNAHGWCP